MILCLFPFFFCSKCSKDTHRQTETDSIGDEEMKEFEMKLADEEEERSDNNGNGRLKVLKVVRGVVVILRKYQ